MVIKNKSAAEMTIGTIIIIVLGVIVLVFLVWGFSSGWNNLWGKITSFSGGSSNVDNIKQACALACSSGQTTQYCSDVQTVKNGDGTTVKGTCATLGYNSGCSIPCSNTPSTCSSPAVWKFSCNSATEDDLTSNIQNSETHDISKEKCCNQKGNAATAKCKGSVALCTSLTSQQACLGQKTCSWTSSNTCTGTATPCLSITTNVDNACTNQQGCTWG